LAGIGLRCRLTTVSEGLFDDRGAILRTLCGVEEGTLCFGLAELVPHLFCRAGAVLAYVGRLAEIFHLELQTLCFGHGMIQTLDQYLDLLFLLIDGYLAFLSFSFLFF
jgi:hypothetical protein